jgi:hypothetical protein
MAQAKRVHSTPPTNTPIDMKRRRFLTVAAAASVVSVGTLAVAAISTAAMPAAVTTDPVYAAIERYKEAAAAHEAALQELDRLERIDPDWDHGWITERPCHDEFNAFDALLEAAALTLPGLLAKLAYLQDIVGREAWLFEDHQGTAIRLIESFAGSISALTQVRP